jgi:hypothetical protein
MYESDLMPKHAVAATAVWRVPSNLYSLGKACDEWLQKRYNAEGRKTGNHWTRTGGREPETEVQRLARAIRKHEPKPKRTKAKKSPKPPKAEKPPKPIKAPRERKPAAPRKRNRARYATVEERRAAIAASVAATWAAMTPAERAARHTKMIGARKPASAVPRHKRPEWKAYKLEYDRQRRATQVLSPEAIAKRRADARRQYANRKAKAAP